MQWVRSSLALQGGSPTTSKVYLIIGLPSFLLKKAVFSNFLNHFIWIWLSASLLVIFLTVFFCFDTKQLFSLVKGKASLTSFQTSYIIPAGMILQSVIRLQSFCANANFLMPSQIFFYKQHSQQGSKSPFELRVQKFYSCWDLIKFPDFHLSLDVLGAPMS